MFIFSKKSLLKLFAVTTIVSMAWSGDSFAQIHNNAMMSDRLERIERSISNLERNSHRSSSPVVSSGDSAYNEEQIRSFIGRVEVLENRVLRLEERLENIQKNYDFRINELSANIAALQTQAQSHSQPVNTEQAKTDSSKKEEPKPATSTPAPASTEPLKEFETPKEHYNHAFKLLNQSKFDEAGGYLESFVSKHSKDPLIGNAYYWLGEVYYVKKDYMKAADNFRKGYEALPKGPKAPDNLFKLGMSLAALDKIKEACVVYKRVQKFPELPQNVKVNNDKELKKHSCN